MDIVKTATDWTRAEMLSSAYVVLVGLAFLLASLGFWRIGQTDMARAYVMPTLVAGVAILVLGVGLFLPSLARVTSFPADYSADAPGFIAAEIARADKVLTQYRVAVFRVFPVLLALCALLIPVLQTPGWRAGLTTAIVVLAAVLLIDTNANARLEIYKEQLLQARDWG